MALELPTLSVTASAPPPASPPVVPVAGVACDVAIYPAEGGNIFLGGGNARLRQVQVSRSLLGGAGSFSITLAPGGPNGVNSRPYWSDIITPMSLVVIGMKRGAVSQIVMVGFVRSIGPSETRSSQAVNRDTTITGADVQYLFDINSYYALTFLGFTQGAAQDVGPVGLGSILMGNNLSGTPASLGERFYNNVMANGVMDEVSFAYGKSQIAFSELVATLFKEYDSAVSIPFALNYILEEGNWTGKFQSIFPYPWYEFFVMTVPGGYFGTEIAEQNLFTLPGYPVGSGPVLVARPNPLPWAKNIGSGGAVQFELQDDEWNSLPLLTADNASQVSSSLQWDDNGVKNFYTLITSFMASLYGASNSNVAQFIYQYGAWTDPNSVHRYGYRPANMTTPWFTDPAGQGAVQSNANGVTFNQYEQLVGDVSLRATSYYQPLPLMARAQFSSILRPDAMPGSRFRFAPYKDGETWDFYIDSVAHSYAFGAGAATTLGLSRGLPSTIYADPDSLLAAHTGKLTRLTGKYAVDDTLPGLQVLSAGDLKGVQGVLGQLSKVFVTPQG